MTRVSLLQEQRDIFTTQRDQLELQREGIHKREQQAVVDALSPMFAHFSEGVTVEVLRSSVYFKMAHPEYSYLKELFNLYLREDWNEDGPAFKAVDLSYYSTSALGVDAWELKRLQLLGKVAGIVHESHDKIVDAVNNAVFPFKQEFRAIHEQIMLINKGIKEVDEKLKAFKRQEIEFDLLNGEVLFDKRGVNIQLKHNYTPWIKSIKLVDVSKSGKKATAVFEFPHGGHVSREENVNVSSIIDQVYGLRNSIVQELLPA